MKYLESRIIKKQNSIIGMQLKLASLIHKIDTDENFLGEAANIILSTACETLDFEQGEIYILLDENKKIPNYGSVNSEWRFAKAIAAIGFDTYSNYEYTRDLIESKVGPVHNAIIRGIRTQVYKNKGYIKKLETEGILRANFWEEMVEKESGRDARNTVFPVLRPLDDGAYEVPAFANFSIPKDYLMDDEPVPDELLDLAQQGIYSFAAMLIASGLVEERNNAYRELEKSIEERVRLSGLAQIGLLAGEISHSLGNHSTRIAQNLRMIEKNLRDGKFQKALEKIVNCIESNNALNDLTTRFYNMGTTSSKYTYSHLNNGLETILSLDRDQEHSSFPVSIITDFDNSIGDVYHNVSNFSQAYAHILRNSNKALKLKKQLMEQRSVPFTPEIKVTTTKENDKVKIIFRDNGIGISEDNISKVFDVEFTTKPQGEGVGGYGLAYCYKVMKEHNGDIEVKSKELEYCEITLILPYKTSLSL